MITSDFLEVSNVFLEPGFELFCVDSAVVVRVHLVEARLLRFLLLLAPLRAERFQHLTELDFTILVQVAAFHEIGGRCV